MKSGKTLVLMLVMLMLLISYATKAQWSTDPAINNAVGTTTDSQKNPKTISDGSGGVIVVWQDRRSGVPAIYAQRINAVGTPLWTANGVAICTSSGDQLNPVIVPDGSGGAIIAWEDLRGNVLENIYAQRVNANGVLQWATDGVAVSVASGIQRNLTMVPVSTVGAIMVWEDFRSGTNYDIYAQYISGSGTNVWTADGRVVCTAINAQVYPEIVSVGTAETIITWEDSRGTSSDIYAQKMNAAGTAQWTADGVVVCSASSNQARPVITGDGSGGGIIAWADGRNGLSDIFAQRVNTSGVVQWSADGVAICSAASDQQNPKIIPGGSGSATIAWEDNRSGTSFDIYAHRVNGSGVVQWITDGVAICATTGDQTNPQMISDQSNGAILVWEDLRGLNRDLYAQRVNNSGTVQWTNNGVAIATAANAQSKPSIVYDNNSFGQGAFIAWIDSRTGTADANQDVYAQRVNLNGFLCGNVSSPGAITGNQTILAGSSNTYSVATVLGVTSYTWTLPSGWTGTSSTNSINATANGTSGDISVSTSNACGSSTGSSTLAITVNKQNQTITFNALTQKTFGDATFDLTATATSSLAVGYASSNTAVATISGSTVTIVGAGTTTITASQAGNDIFNAATNVTQDLIVIKANQTITFGALSSKTFGDAAFTVSATASSGLTVVYSSSNTAIATVSGNTVTLVAAGSVSIHANQAGNTNFNAATQVSQTFCVNPAKPTITATQTNTETPILTSSSSTGNQWHLNNTAITGATNNTLSVTAAGVYKVQVTSGGCASAFSDNYTFIITADRTPAGTEFIVYPNPTYDKIKIVFPEFNGLKNVSIYSMNGQRTDLRETTDSETEFNVANYEHGIYLVRVTTTRFNYIKKFIKK